MTTPESVPAVALARAEEIVTGYALGSIKSTSLFFEFFGCGSDCPQLPPAIEDACEDAAAAFRAWSKATDTDGHWQTPKERRAALDKALRALVAALDAATTRKAVA